MTTTHTPTTHTPRVRAPGRDSSSGPDSAPAVVAEALSVQLPDGPDWATALDAVSVTVPAGSTVAVVGASGAGKSTLLHTIAGALPSGTRTAGQVTLHHPGHGLVELLGLSEPAWRRVRGRTVGLLSQHDLFTPTMTIAAHLYDAHPAVDVAALAATCGVSAQVLDRVPGQLSGGQLRLASAMAAVLFDPKVLVCDEPTGGLDAATAAPVVEVLRGRAGRATTVLATHDMAVADAVADWLVVLDAGRVVQQGPFEAVLGDPATDLVARLTTFRSHTRR